MLYYVLVPLVLIFDFSGGYAYQHLPVEVHLLCSTLVSNSFAYGCGIVSEIVFLAELNNTEICTVVFHARAGALACILSL